MIQLGSILISIYIFYFLKLGILTANELKLEENGDFKSNKKTWITLDPFDNIELTKNNDTMENENSLNLLNNESCRENLVKLYNENKRVRNALLRERNMKQMFFVGIVKKFNIDLNDNGYFFSNGVYKECSINFNSDILNKVSNHIKKEYSIDDEPEIFENVLKDLFLDSMICDKNNAFFENENTISYCCIIGGIVAISIIFVNTDSIIFARLRRYIISLAFCFSICAEYYRQYQLIIANKMANMELNESLEDVCRSKGAFFESLMSYFQLFSLTKSKSECLLRHESMLTSPFSEINILSVVVKVLTSALLTPLSVFGQQSNEFYHEYFRDTTLPLFIVKLLILVFVILLLFFYFSNFQIRTWFWTFGPASPSITYHEPKPLNVSKSIKFDSSLSKVSKRSRSLSRIDNLNTCQ